MPTSDPTEILLRHFHWSTRNILDACVPLSSEQFHRRFEMGVGSLHDTITHVLTSTRGWTDLLTGNPQRPPLDGTQRTPQQLQPLLEETARDFIDVSRAHRADELVSRERGGKLYTFPRGGVITHVTTHGMHHRAQMLNMLRHVGVSPLPKSAVVEWMIAGEPA